MLFFSLTENLIFRTFPKEFWPRKSLDEKPSSHYHKCIPFPSISSYLDFLDHLLCKLWWKNIALLSHWGNNPHLFHRNCTVKSLMLRKFFFSSLFTRFWKKYRFFFLSFTCLFIFTLLSQCLFPHRSYKSAMKMERANKNLCGKVFSSTTNSPVRKKGVQYT